MVRRLSNALKALLGSRLFWLAATPLLLLAAYAFVAAWLRTSYEHAPLKVIEGVTATPILDPHSFPPLEGIDPNAFDVAPDGSFVFRQGDRLVLCDTRTEPPTLSVLVEQKRLDAFAFDAGGSLLTVTGGVLGVYAADAPPEKSEAPPPRTFKRAGVPLVRLASTAGGALTATLLAQSIPVGPSGGRSIPVGPSGGRSFPGGGGGSGESWFGEWKFSELFFKPPDERVTENAIGHPPPPGEGGGFTVIVREEDRKQWPLSTAAAAVLPSNGMRLARTDKPGEMLLYGGDIPDVYSDVHLLRSDGTAQWLVSSDETPVAIAAAAGGQLYVVTRGRVEHHTGAGSAYDIIRLPLEGRAAPSLVFGADVLAEREPIESLALAPGGRLLFFSTRRKVYAVDGPLVVKVLDGLGGVLRVSGDRLYVFNANRRVLLALSGLVQTK